MKIHKFNYKYYKDKKAMNNYDILFYVNKLKIDNFIGVFMKNNLPQNLSNKTECAIVNLDSSNSNGTHWVCYYIKEDKSYYFDTFGLYPPSEIQRYLRSYKIFGNSLVLQEFNTNYCGYLCLYVLSCLSKGFQFENIVLSLFETFENFKLYK